MTVKYEVIYIKLCGHLSTRQELVAIRFSVALTCETHHGDTDANRQQEQIKPAAY